MARTMSLDEMKKRLGVGIKEIPKELDKATKEDAEYLKTKIYEAFDNVSNTPIYGYYLEGKGSVFNENTIAFEGTYNKKWQKPNIKPEYSENGATLVIIGSDAKILEYGLSPLSMSSLRWVHNSEEGYYNAHNSYGNGNWYRAIELSAGNTSPLVSYGEHGSRFFAKYSTPTMFIRKACKEYETAVKNNSTSVKLTANGLKTIIEKELNK
jgi:hypothetical protein